MHRDLEIMILDDRRQIHLGELCHKNIYYDTEQSLTKYLVRVNEIGTRRTRRSNKGNFQIPRCRTVMGVNAFSVRGPKFWNSLDNNLKVLEKFTVFAKELHSKWDQTLDNHPT